MANEKQRRAFISYSRTNKEFATKLAKGLRSAGYPIWFDLMDIPTGSRWDDEVEKALRECSVFMIILTPASIASENVKDEIGYAIDHGKRILPVLLENCEVPLRLRRFQYVDFTTKSFEEGFESAKELLGDLIDEASVPVPARTSTVENQMTVKAKYERYAPVKPATEHKDVWESGVGRKKPVSKGLVTGIVGAVAVLILCIIAGIGFNALYKMVNSNTPVVNPATETLVVAKQATETPVATQPPPATAAPGLGTLEALATQAPPPAGPITSDTMSAIEAIQLYEDTKSFNRLAKDKYGDQYGSMYSSQTPYNIENPTLIPLMEAVIYCAVNKEILEDNLSSVEAIFEFNEKKISESEISQLDNYPTDDNGDVCQTSFVVIGNWERGSTYYFKATYIVTKPYNDGRYDTPAGDHTKEFIVSIP